VHVEANGVFGSWVVDACIGGWITARKSCLGELKLRGWR
jgi:hypothetical protein